jgi:hypothetical protein
MRKTMRRTPLMTIKLWSKLRVTYVRMRRPPKIPRSPEGNLRQNVELARMLAAFALVVKPAAPLFSVIDLRGMS